MSLLSMFFPNGPHPVNDMRLDIIVANTEGMFYSFIQLHLTDASSVLEMIDTTMHLINLPSGPSPSKRARRDEKLPPSHALHKLWLLREQSNTESFIVQRKWQDTHASSTNYWVMTLQDEINTLLCLRGKCALSGILIREEYVEALRAVIEVSETGNLKNNFPATVADDEDEESHQSKLGVHDYFFNPFFQIFRNPQQVGAVSS